MSASDKKRQRKAAAAQNMTQRQKEAQKEAKSLKMYTIGFWVAMILIVAIVAGMLLYNPVDGMIRNFTTAVQVGDVSLSAVELNYFYIDEIETYAKNYSIYLESIINPYTAIGHQYYDAEKKVTWADNFLDMTITTIQDTYALYNAAKAANFKLSAEDQKYIDNLKVNLKAYADYYSFGSVNDYLVSIYGNGASEKTYLAYYEIVKTADAYYNAKGEELRDSYTPAQLRDFEKEKPYNYNSYSYVSFLLSLDKFKIGGTKNEDGSYTYTDAQMAQFREELKAAAEKLSAAENNTLEKLNEAIKALEIELDAKNPDKDNASTPTTGATTTAPTTAATTTAPSTTAATTTAPSTTAPTTGATTAPSGATTTAPTTKPSTDSSNKEPTYSTAKEEKDLLYTRITSAIQEWIRSDERKAGEITMIANTVKETKEGKEVDVINGYYIVIYNGMNKNEYALANVRHVLIGFEGGTTDSTTGATTYSEAEKKAAKDKAEKLLADWKKAGDLSEESFAELAKKNSEDGNADQGGLYEDVYPGQMTTNFNDWCFDESRKAGDTDIVETEYGYHIIFYVGDSKTVYRDYMIANDKQAQDLSTWKSALLAKTIVVKKNTNFINRNKKVQASSSY